VTTLFLTKGSKINDQKGWGKEGEMTQTLYAHMNKKYTYDQEKTASSTKAAGKSGYPSARN
jgi:hypothetical protein